MTTPAVSLVILDVEARIVDLRSLLGTAVAENDLLAAITERLAVLRQSFPAHKSSFTQSHIDFLRDVAGLVEPLKLFIDMKEELDDVGTIKDYQDIIRRLVDLKGRLAPHAVSKRIAREIRRLNESLPGIMNREEANRSFRFAARIIEMEKKPRACGRKHAMVIRVGSHGYFWGCSRYPFCQETALLSSEEKRRMGG